MVCQQNCVARPLLCPFHRYLVWATKECVYCKQDCEVQIEVGIAIFSSYIFSKCLFEKILSTAVAAAFIEKKEDGLCAYKARHFQVQLSVQRLSIYSKILYIWMQIFNFLK